MKLNYNYHPKTNTHIIFKIICVLRSKTKDGCHQSFKVINKNYLQWLLLNFEVGFVEMT